MYLRQEFRELEMLNEITYLRYHNMLSASVKGVTRRDLLRSFQELKGGEYQPPGMNAHVKWKEGDQPLLLPKVFQAKWTLVGDDIPKTSDPGAKKTKGRRKSAASGDAVAKPKSPKKPKIVESGPTSTVWIVL
ncbi:hypothetical protein B0H10DRAFT_2374684 [Mycena sp. CBHHK59/15]|nr:hypothetical protein B0H10DRAFT_2374684 [Mycena sp. CBHHK59/15]